MELMTRLLDPSGFPARWQCGPGWADTPWLGWLHIVSDLGVWSAYVAIPLVLGYFLWQRKDLPFRKIFLLFGAFILACGTTHLMEAIIFWWPVYRLAAVIKFLTAVVSWATVISLFRVVPGVLTMRTPEELEREIIARMRAEEELKSANAELEQRVLARTTDLTQAVEKLTQADRALKEAGRRKDEFLATLSHELRNPLTPIRYALEVMKQANGSADLIEQARSTMERQMGYMVRIIDDLLDVNRITRNKLDLRKDRVELAPIIHHAVEACRSLADSANHELNISLPPEQVYVNADAVRLAQVFGNLLFNACKYTERGGRIWLTVEREGRDVVVKIRDTGVGIPPEMLPKVFEMFTQIDRTLERSQGGLGVGLTLVKRLVEMHDGTVTAHSQGQGQGSEFVVHLPILIENPKVEEPLEPIGENIQITSHRILVVDDNRASTLLHSKIFKLNGNDVQTAQDGVEAVEKAEEFKPDIILLDIGLPKLNGYDACRAIREQPWGKAIIIIALTGYGQEDDIRKAQEAGFNSHMVKPVDHASLVKMLVGLQNAQKWPATATVAIRRRR